MSERFKDFPPNEKPITELHAWIAVYEEGGEGIMAGIVGGTAYPLVSSSRKTAVRMKCLADDVVEVARAQAGRIVTPKLVTFRRVEE